METLLLRRSWITLQKSEAEEYHIDSALFRADYKICKQAVVVVRKNKNHSPLLSGLKSAAELFRGSHVVNLKKVYLFGRIAMQLQLLTMSVDFLYTRKSRLTGDVV